jgi:hypothetical protein
MTSAELIPSLLWGYQHTFQLERIAFIPHAGIEFQNLSGYQIDIVDEHPEGDFLL